MSSSCQAADTQARQRPESDVSVLLGATHGMGRATLWASGIHAHSACEAVGVTQMSVWEPGRSCFV